MLLMYFYMLVGFFCCLDAKKVQITVTSVNCAYDKCSKCGSQIITNNKDYSQKQDGINIVVLDPTNGDIVNSVSFPHSKNAEFKIFIDSIKDNFVVIVTSQLLCTKYKTKNLRKQKMIISTFEKLGAVSNILPISYRSGVHIFCKEKCSAKYPTNINLPFTKFKETNEDPIHISFSIMLGNQASNLVTTHPLHNGDELYPTQTNVVRQQSTSSESNDIQLLLLSSIIPCVIVALIAIFVFVYFKVKETKKSPLIPKKQLNEKAIEFCECRKNLKSHSFNCGDKTPTNKRALKASQSERIFTSNKKLRHTSSMRMFEKFEQSDDVQRKDSTFAAYVKIGPGSTILKPCVETADEEETLYKTPSNIRRYQPPKDLPPLCESKITPVSAPTKNPDNHVYASPYEVGFIRSSGINGRTKDIDFKKFKKLSTSTEFSCESTNSYDYTEQVNQKKISCSTLNNESSYELAGEQARQAGNQGYEVYPENNNVTCKQSYEIYPEENNATTNQIQRYLPLSASIEDDLSYKDLSFTQQDEKVFSSESDSSKTQQPTPYDTGYEVNEKANRDNNCTYSSYEIAEKDDVNDESRDRSYYSYSSQNLENDNKKLRHSNNSCYNSEHSEEYQRYELETLLYGNDFWEN